MRFEFAFDVQNQIVPLIRRLGLDHIDPQRVVCFRSFGSRSKAKARIWALPRIWQKALNVAPHYCLEVLSENFDHLSPAEQTKVLIHELLHIPKTFSGALLPHRGRGGRVINRRTVEALFQKLGQR